MEKNRSKIRELGEIPGVEFPDLATIDEYLHFWASHKVVGNRTLYSWLNDEGKVTDKCTYQDVDARASLIAQKLLTSSKPVIKPGDRVLLLHPPGLDFVDAFFGCLRARVSNLCNRLCFWTLNETLQKTSTSQIFLAYR